MTTGKIDCFLAASSEEKIEGLVSALKSCPATSRIRILKESAMSWSAMEMMARESMSAYTLLCLDAERLTLSRGCVGRMLQVAEETGAALVYADRWEKKEGKLEKHPVIDHQMGSVRNDFDFGGLLLIRTDLLKEVVMECGVAGGVEALKWAGFYQLWLGLSRRGELFHLNEYLYTLEEEDLRKSGEKQFDYVDPANREVQIEMERVVTSHLKALGALIDGGSYTTPDFGEQDFDVEASVVIPVKNRVKTIADAVRCALSQETSFAFNVIVVDNHSTDGTTDLLRQFGDKRLVHIIPEERDLGIGGCWNVAIGSEFCGRFAVQLDSDDVYSSSKTLERIVTAFYDQGAAMVVGSYRMCDFSLNTIGPGVIDHREWTEENGMNNALRVNGLGAPRAFFTPYLREIRFPNTSYGEDYAMGLAFSRRWRIGRIYDEVYLCRRWSGNSDADLSVEQENTNNFYKDRLRTIEIKARIGLLGKEGSTSKGVAYGERGVSQDCSEELHRFMNRQLDVWELARRHFQELSSVETRDLTGEESGGEAGVLTGEKESAGKAAAYGEEKGEKENEITLKAQWNASRIVSTGARIDRETLKERPCFLCAENRPHVQLKKRIGERFVLLVNPYPIMPLHFTIASTEHVPQRIKGNYGEMRNVLDKFPELTVFYNGPKCGASAPDHLHFQACNTGMLPMQAQWQRLIRGLQTIYKANEEEMIAFMADYPAPALLIKSRCRQNDEYMFQLVYEALTNIEEESVGKAGAYGEGRGGTAEHLLGGMDSSKEEPMMNLMAWKEGEDVFTVVFLRKKHRPSCYEELMVSPGAIDMAGMLITPREADFRHLTGEKAVSILREVSLSPKEVEMVVEKIKAAQILAEESVTQKLKRNEPSVKVGIVGAEKIVFTLNDCFIAKGETIEGTQEVAFSEGGILWKGNHYRELKFKPQSPKSSFSMNDVTIGLGFHWERKETQTFQGALHLVVEEGKIYAINVLPVEQYLTSVISSEMSSTSSPELLKAHAVISRSWLLAQIARREKGQERGDGFFSFVKKENEIIRWYDRDDHTIFDVCADDHCQRYQGITRATNPHVREAIRATRGKILTYNGEICDTRFSKCCGGRTEEFQYCWEDTPKPYLVSVECPYCNTSEKKIIGQILNDYDQETSDFFEWHEEYSAEKLSRIVAAKLKTDLGRIVELKPIERGKSGRISKLEIRGTKGCFTVGKELEIRRVLSESHLKSSLFYVTPIDITAGQPMRFRLDGRGWGHGVGLCQIGAAVMGEKGFSYENILLHYYPGAEISEIYR